MDFLLIFLFFLLDLPILPHFGPARHAGRPDFFLRGPVRRPPPGSILRPRPLKKKSGRPAWRAGPKWGKICQSNRKNRKINRKSIKIY